MKHQEVCVIDQEEIRKVIKELPKGKACGNDNIPAEYWNVWKERD